MKVKRSGELSKKNVVAPAKPAPEKDLESVVNSLRHVLRSLRASSHGAETELGISGAQLFVLQELAAVGAASLGEIAARTLTHQSSVSVVVSRLAAAGYIEKGVSAEDASRAELRVTATGRALLRKSPELAHTKMVAALRLASASDLRATARVLGAVAAHLGAGGEPAEMFFEGERLDDRRSRPSSKGGAR